MGCASPKPETPEWRSSTTRTSSVSTALREMTNVSASSSVPIRAETSTAGTYQRQGAARLPLSPAPVAQGIERAPPEREVAGSIPARRIQGRMVERTPHGYAVAVVWNVLAERMVHTSVTRV
jgi:hypothetical protein